MYDAPSSLLLFHVREAGLDEREARLELACHIFDAGKLSRWSAAKWAGLDRPGFEEDLRRSGIALYRPTLDDLADDLTTLDRLGT